MPNYLFNTFAKNGVKKRRAVEYDEENTDQSIIHTGDNRAQVKAETHAVVDAGILLLSELLSTSQAYALSKLDIERSGTRAEEKQLDTETLAKVYTLRRMIDAMGGGHEALLPILERLSRTHNNQEFLDTLVKS
jgi:transcription termination factor Rho